MAGIVRAACRARAASVARCFSAKPAAAKKEDQQPPEQQHKQTSFGTFRYQVVQERGPPEKWAATHGPRNQTEYGDDLHHLQPAMMPKYYLKFAEEE